MFWMAVWAQYVLEVGSSQGGVNLKQSRGQHLRFVIAPSERATCSGDTQCCVVIRNLSQCHLCPDYSVIITASKEMSVRGPYLHRKEGQIGRAQAHSLSKVRDCSISFAEPHFDPAA